MRLNTNSKPEGTRREGPPFPRNLNTRVSQIHPSNLPLEKRREEEERRGRRRLAGRVACCPGKRREKRERG